MALEFFSADQERWVALGHGERCVSLAIESWPPRQGPTLGLVLTPGGARALAIALIEQAAYSESGELANAAEE